ncbi:MAG: xanthine dehydrogenase family protein subunit M, partial [Deltaproteobacteria bacterium]
MKRIAYLRPRTVEEALSDRKATGGLFVAGGTDLIVRLNRREIRPAALVSLRNVDEIRKLQKGNGRASIGSAATVSEIVSDGDLERLYPLLVEAASRLGTPQIRQVATLGGNLGNCSPCADTMPPLLVYGASIVLRSEEGEHTVRMEDFARGPGQSCMEAGELMTRVELDPPPRGARTAFFKKGRVHADLALASLAALVVMDGDRIETARFAAGSVAPTCMRLRQTEALLEGR